MPKHLLETRGTAVQACQQQLHRLVLKMLLFVLLLYSLYRFRTFLLLADDVYGLHPDDIPGMCC